VLPRLSSLIAQGDKILNCTKVVFLCEGAKRQSDRVAKSQRSKVAKKKLGSRYLIKRKALAWAKAFSFETAKVK
jgi:hypothetical protein